MYAVINTYQTQNAKKLEALRKEAAREIFRILCNYSKYLQEAHRDNISSGSL